MASRRGARPWLRISRNGSDSEQWSEELLPASEQAAKKCTGRPKLLLQRLKSRNDFGRPKCTAEAVALP